jgi:hypothetical protein
MAHLILDGYTLEGRVAARGPWPELLYRYRPALSEEVFDYLSQSRANAGAASGKQSVRQAAEFACRHLVGWGLLNPQGESVAITPEVLARIPHPYLMAIVNEIMGYSSEQQVADLGNSAKG